MPQFQIHNSLGESIPINKLDEQAAAFWDKPVHPKRYATPYKPEPGEDTKSVQSIVNSQRGNWFDTIGWNIASPKVEYTDGWDNVKESMFSVCMIGDAKHLFTDHMNAVIGGARLYLKPYFDLIDHWESMGYKPVQIKTQL
jgi:hypothetical protein